jgi:LacI family transcriptional regulator
LPELKVSDDQPAAEAVVARLVELGHRRIGLISGLQVLNSGRNRRSMYERALEANGLVADLVEIGDYSPQSGAAAAYRLLDAEDPPTAIIAANDMMAIAAMSAIQKRGLRVPEDVSVVGWEDIPLSALLEPSLSSVSFDPFWVGAQGAHALLRVIEGEELHQPTPRVPKFVERGSIGPARRP